MVTTHVFFFPALVAFVLHHHTHFLFIYPLGHVFVLAWIPGSRIMSHWIIDTFPPKVARS